jgi:hypothetical protein
MALDELPTKGLHENTNHQSLETTLDIMTSVRQFATCGVHLLLKKGVLRNSVGATVRGLAFSSCANRQKSSIIHLLDIID